MCGKTIGGRVSQLLLVDTDDLSASHKDSRAECQPPLGSVRPSPVSLSIVVTALVCLCLSVVLFSSVSPSTPQGIMKLPKQNGDLYLTLKTFHLFGFCYEL